MTDLRKQLLKEKGAKLHPKNSHERQENSYEPHSWEKYFDSKEVIAGGFQVYRAGSSGPICVFLHGAGHSSLTWALVAVRLTSRKNQFQLSVTLFGILFIYI
jgi:protein phosphatase methylesterase 1